MSAKDTEVEKGGLLCCTNCGKAEIDDIKLKDCDGCDRVRYCSDECQQVHLETHETICKERAAELRDELLFKQPECRHLGDCPICFLPMPLATKQSVVQTCCGKIICIGCCYANQISVLKQRLKPKCPFCRHAMPNTDKEIKKMLKNRAAANDPVALHQIGLIHKNKLYNYRSAFKYLERAAELGDVEAHYDLSICYRDGLGVEKDEGKMIFHLEEAAIAGNHKASYNLGCHEDENRRFERAVKHWIIAANLGDNYSIQALKEYYKDGLVSKDDFAAALRAHQSVVDATKSPQREAAEAYYSC